VTSLSNWAIYAADGTHQVCNLTITSAPNFANLNGTLIGSLSQGSSFSFAVSTNDTVEDGYLYMGDNPSCPGNNYDFGPATIIGNRFTHYFQIGSANLIITGTFSSSTSASGRYRVIDSAPGSPCNVDLTWTATKP
jgi:hypothetical protein